ncbi:peptidoglycan-associated lipoprotein Pal [Rhodobacterales bacterium HKCCE3408]|nr:peptidoglycan-associated lipoprotein Pal [Rhodobacterales bacterium HKCCE3408]
MKFLTRALLLLAVIGLSACTQGALGRGGAGGAGAAGQGGPSDPRSVAYFNQTVGDRVLFDVDVFTLDDGARAVLDGQAEWLMTNPEYTAVIEGHADEQGTQEYNFRLGERRANSVYQYLVSQGVAPNRLRTVSFGKERPLEICSEEACYRQNRRAVTVLSIGTGA